MPEISIVIPLLNEEDSLKELANWIDEVCKKNALSYEIIFVDDGSKDNSWNIIEQLKNDNQNIRGLKLRGNHGKSLALKAGFKYVKGNVVFTMDADLQDSPEEIPPMYKMIKEDGLDIVSGWKKVRYDPITKTIPTKLFNWVARKASGLKLHDFNCGLKAYKRDVTDTIDVYGEMHRYIPILAQSCGFSKIDEKVVKHQARKYGYTKFGIDRFINGMLDMISIVVLKKFGKRPMHFFGAWGVFMFLLCFLSASYIGIMKLVQLSEGIHGQLVIYNPWFFISLSGMQLGVMFFLTGFICELMIKNRRPSSDYYLEKEI